MKMSFLGLLFPQLHQLTQTSVDTCYNKTPKRISENNRSWSVFIVDNQTSAVWMWPLCPTATVIVYSPVVCLHKKHKQMKYLIPV